MILPTQNNMGKQIWGQGSSGRHERAVGSTPGTTCPHPVPRHNIAGYGLYKNIFKNLTNQDQRESSTGLARALYVEGLGLIPGTHGLLSTTLKSPKRNQNICSFDGFLILFSDYINNYNKLI